LSREIDREKKEREIALQAKDDTIGQLKKRLEETNNDYQDIRKHVLVGVNDVPYVEKLEKDIKLLKKEYFHSIAVGIKLHRSIDGDYRNIDISELFDLCLKNNIPFKDWPAWLASRFEGPH